jgi:putative ABC transport system permease protein
MSLSLVLAFREMRSGVAGFRIFLACLALGVAALAAAGSTAEAFRQGLAAQSRVILGGDVAVSVRGRRFTDQERTFFQQLGRTAESIHTRAMAARMDNAGERRLVEISGVDEAYPLVGALELQGAASLVQATAAVNGFPGAAVAPELLTRLNISIGDSFLIGDQTFVARSALIKEPDRLSRGFSLGPRVLVARQALTQSGLLAGDVLSGQTMTIALASTMAPETALQAIADAFPKAPFKARGRNNALEGIERLINRLEFFLGFIGLAALLAGGLGVASAVSAYLIDRRPSIAVLKALGADGALVRNVYLIQIAVLAALGIVIGLGIGAAMPLGLGWLIKNSLPIEALFAIYPLPLAKAGLFGALAAAAFSLAALGRARSTSPASLFRRDLDPAFAMGPETIAASIAGVGLIILTGLAAPNLSVGAGMLGTLVAAFIILWAVGKGVAWSATVLRQFFSGAIRVGLANLAGPRSAARTATPAMGFGIGLLTTIVVIQSSLLAEVSTQNNKATPNLYFTQIAPETVGDFDTLIAAIAGPLTPANYRRYPFATGRITALNGTPLTKEDVSDDVRWAIDQDITLSALASPPVEAQLTAGNWWADGYSGPPLMVIDDDIARGAKFKIGDTLTISVLGRNIEVQIAGQRSIDFGSFGANFPIILNANAVRGANLREVAIARATEEQERTIIAELGRRFTSVNVISVREQLEAASKIFDQIGWAIRGAASVTVLASLFVLIGAIAANARDRAREAVILKVLGGARGFILTAYAAEYGAVGLFAGVTGVAIGLASAYPVVLFVFKTVWAPDWMAIAGMLVAVVSLTMALGAWGAMIVLRQRPAPVLRGE